MSHILFIDLEIDQNGKVVEAGACSTRGLAFRSKHLREIPPLMKDVDILAGHNIIRHDLKYLEKMIPDVPWSQYPLLDTLMLSPLLFPKRPYHRLVKDDRLKKDELNNPYHDACKSKEVWEDEWMAFQKADDTLKKIWHLLLGNMPGFSPLFTLTGHPRPKEDLSVLIKDLFKEKVCSNADIEGMIQKDPVALAYCLSLIHADDAQSLTPPWVLKNYPEADRFMTLLRALRCKPGCDYCNSHLDIHQGLRKFFGFDQYRRFGGINLQEQAVGTAVNGDSLLAIFPTGGGKSITFQVPALMAGEAIKGLTVVISPLQSLMKDQVDNLEERGLVAASTINGLLDPIERQKAIERVEEGIASILYISPESLRSKTIEKLLLKRKIARFVIDEAHCLSSWGQDFRVDYLYIGYFIRHLQEEKRLVEPIPVSCFTATAKLKVVEDILQYFKDKLGLELKLFNAGAERTNLHYRVLHRKDDHEKFRTIRELLEMHRCPTIIYVSRTKKAKEIAQRLSEEGFNTSYYHGKMDSADKVENQNKFIKGEYEIMVATSAFGMGVDKKDVGMVIHYDISDSLENYVQEAGRAGRDENLQAECYVLFDEEDLNKHFILLNQTRLQLAEIKDIWKALKALTKYRKTITQSALEIAREAGWDDSVNEVETRVKTAIAALEDAGYLQRKQNSPSIFANSILVKSAQEAINKIHASPIFRKDQVEPAIRIIKRLFSSKRSINDSDEEAEYRIDYLSDKLGILRENVVEIIHLMKEEKILGDTKDLKVFIKHEDNSNKTRAIAIAYTSLEEFLLKMLKELPDADFGPEAGTSLMLNIKEVNDRAEKEGLKKIDTRKIVHILNYWTVKKWIKSFRHPYNKNLVKIQLLVGAELIAQNLERHRELSSFIIDFLFDRAAHEEPAINFVAQTPMVSFSVHELKDAYQNGLFGRKAEIAEIEDALFFLSRIRAIDIEGGFLVIYNRLTIERKEDNLRAQYKAEDYSKLKLFYEQKVEQIHIVGEYARKMLQSYEDALLFVKDYFSQPYDQFLQKYFKGDRLAEIKRTITPAKFRKIYGELSPIQLQIINDRDSQYIVVAAGPGSGKTKVLVHKLASLLLVEEVKQEDLLMLTFSRAAASEFRERLMDFVGNVVGRLQIKTFHSYCFDLLGKQGNLEKTDNIIEEATEKIRNKEVEPSRLTTRILVIDEAQDMAPREQQLVYALMEHNPDMRVLAVGDDDQNIYAFRGADNQFLSNLIQQYKAAKYELTTNYRSKQNLVDFTEAFVRCIPNRLKSGSNQSHDSLSKGTLQVISHASQRLISCVAENLGTLSLEGTTAILCPKNQETFTLSALLQNKGLNVRLIQSQEGFHLHNLQELRYFTNRLNQVAGNKIEPNQWEKAKAKLEEEFKRSRLLPHCMEIIRQFELTFPKERNKFDWNDHVRECSLDDFLKIEGNTLYISTYHKAKGREFDNVILLSRFPGVYAKPEEKRALYVAMTRAKVYLLIHNHGKGLEWLPYQPGEYIVDPQSYEDPEIISLSAGLDDVWLDYFSNKKTILNDIVAGDELVPDAEGCSLQDGRSILKFSRNFQKELQGWMQKGYHLRAARVQYMVFWKGEKNDQEYLVALPEVEMGRSW